MDWVLSEEWLRSAVDLLVRLVEAAGAIVIFAGSAVGFVRFVSTALRTRLAAVAAIRTALNFFLAREIKEERAEVARGGNLA